jgi:hypothetical protein
MTTLFGGPGGSDGRKVRARDILRRTRQGKENNQKQEYFVSFQLNSLLRK